MYILYFAVFLINCSSTDFILYLSCPLIAQVSNLYNSEHSHSGINVSSTLGKMPEYNQAVWRQKGSNPTTRLPAKRLVTSLGGNSQTKAVFLQNYKKTENMTTSWELQPHVMCGTVGYPFTELYSIRSWRQHDSLLSSLPTVSVFFRFYRPHITREIGVSVYGNPVTRWTTVDCVWNVTEHA